MEGNETFFKEIVIDGNAERVTARQMLRFPELVAVANKHHLGGPLMWEFPV